MAEIKSGDIVYLKSGNSPALTVREKDMYSEIRVVWICEWFLNGRVESYKFLEEQITLEKPQEEPRIIIVDSPNE